MSTRSIKFAKVSVAYLLAVFVYSGCDTIDEPTPFNEPPVSHLAVLPDTTVRVGDQPIRTSLQSRFDGLAEMPTSFRAIVDDASFAYSIDDDTLELAALSEGVDTVVVQAWGSLLLAVDTLVVTSVCSDFVLPGETSYFPHEVGKSWEYNYRDWHEYRGEYTTLGVSTWTIVSVDNKCSSIGLTIREHIEGQHERKYYDLDLSDTTYSVSSTRTLNFSITGDRLDLGSLNGSFSYLQPLYWRTLSRDSLLEASRDKYFGFGSGGYGHVRLAPDHGIVSYRSFTYWRTPGESYETLYWID